MDTPLLKTKLYMPPLRPELVSRPRLIERLKMGLQRKLTLIAAPAGYGKTTLLSEGVSSGQMPVGWLTLDEEDNDPARFWSYVISAIRTVQADIGKSALGLLQSPQAPPIESILTTVINEMSEVSDGFALVLDDYHLIEAQVIHDAVNFLLNHLPPQVHLVISSRTNPPLSLSQLRAQNQLMEVRADDLRFISEEATAFLNDVMNLGLSDEDVATLESRTEGWIASLQLAAVSMQGRENVSTYISEFSGSSRYVMDYLIEEVLRRQEADTQSFLLETAILDRFTPSLCNAVTGRNDSREMLAQLEATNLFLVPLDDERQWYRYHHLFADLLRNQLLQSQQERMTELHLRASQWFEKEGQIDEAIRHAFLAKEFDHAARLVEAVGMDVLARGELTTISKWLDLLPGEILHSSSSLCVIHAWRLAFTGQLESIEPLLKDAAQTLRGINEGDQAEIRDLGTEERQQSEKGNIAALYAYITFLKGELPRARELASQALVDLTENNFVRGHTALVLGASCYFGNDFPAAVQALIQADIIGQAIDDSYIPIMAGCTLARIYEAQGRLVEAATTYKRLLELDDSYTLPVKQQLPINGLAYVGMADLLREWNDLEAATRFATKGNELCQQWGAVEVMTLSNIGQARLLQVRGYLNAAIDFITAAEKTAGDLSPWHKNYVAAYRGQWYLARGDLEAAIRWVQETGLSVDDEPSYHREGEYLTLARVMIAQSTTPSGKSHLHRTLGLLVRLLKTAEMGGRTGSVIEILTLQSIALQAQEDIDQALITLERALSLAEPEGYVRTFIDEGEPMAKLLRLAASRGIAKKYVRKLLADLQRPTSGAEPHPTVLPAEGAVAPSTLVEPLTVRELEVLRLIVAGMSNREIAEKLIIVEGTVKTHINNIFTKLDVQSRTQAIAQARELMLL